MELSCTAHMLCAKHSARQIKIKNTCSPVEVSAHLDRGSVPLSHFTDEEAETSTFAYNHIANHEAEI